MFLCHISPQNSPSFELQKFQEEGNIFKQMVSWWALHPQTPIGFCSGTDSSSAAAMQLGYNHLGHTIDTMEEKLFLRMRKTTEFHFNHKMFFELQSSLFVFHGCCSVIFHLFFPLRRREDFLRIPELVINPLGERIVQAFFAFKDKYVL